MMSKVKYIIVIIALALGFVGVFNPTKAFANAFFIQEMSGSGMAQGGAVVAGAGSPASMFQNAANITFLDGLHLELTGTMYIPDAKYKNPQGEVTKASDTPIITPHFFSSYKINDWVAVGLGVFVDFGLAVEWPDDWEGDHIVQYAGMTSFTINPNVSFGPFKGFAVAVGFDAKWGSIDIKRKMTLGLKPLSEESVTNQLHLGGSAWGFGANIGLMYQPVDWVRIGAAYRSAIKVSLDNGKADFDVIEPFGERFPDQNFKSSITLPHLISMGARFWPHETFSIELDLWVTMWSSYDKLTFDFEKGLEAGPDKRIYQQTEIKDFKDFIQVRLGAEWWVHEMVALRTGIMLDGGVIPDETLDPMLPDNHRINWSVGAGVNYKGFTFDAAYMLVYMLQRDVSNVASNPLPGTYNWIVHDVTLSIGYQYDFFAKDEKKDEIQ